MGWLKELLRANRKQKNVHYMASTNLPVNKIMEHVIKAKLESATVVGWDKNGELCIWSTNAKRGDLYWDLQLAARNVMDR